MRNSLRRGAVTVEFALVVVVLVVLMALLIEIPWYFFQVSELRWDVREAARKAAGTAVASDPESVFTSAFPNDAATATVSGDPPDRIITVSVERDYANLFGSSLIPGVEGNTMTVTYTVRMEDQAIEPP